MTTQAFNTALTDTGTTAQGEQARAKLAEASPDALSNAVAVRGASSETYMSTTKAGFDDEDLYDELAPDDYEDGVSCVALRISPCARRAPYSINSVRSRSCTLQFNMYADVRNSDDARHAMKGLHGARAY